MTNKIDVFIINIEVNEMKLAYVRVSSEDQNETRQVDKMKELGVEDRFIFIDKKSGKDFDREEYQKMKLVLREGDLLYVDSIDRLGRNFEKIQEEWYDITKNVGADVVALDMEDLFDSRKFKMQGDVGKLLESQMLTLLAWVAEQERKKIKTRQREGIEVAKKEGKYKGRKPIAYDKEHFEKLIKEVRAGERTNKYAMAQLGLKPNTYYKAVNEYDTKTGYWSDD